MPLSLEADGLQSPTDLGRHRVSRRNYSRAISDLGSLLSAAQRLQKITLGEMRDSGPRRLLVYCGDYKCVHSVTIDASGWGDGVRLSDLEPRFTCKVCGHRGADIRPLFERPRFGTG